MILFTQLNSAGSFDSHILNKSCYSTFENKKQAYIPHTIALKSKPTENNEISAEKINFLLTESLNDLAMQNKEIQNFKNDKKVQENTTESAPDSTNPTVQENQSQNYSSIETQLLQLINNIRTQNGLPLLSTNQDLTNIAISRNMDMHKRNYFSHYTPDGKNVFNILRENGVMFSYGGENLYECTPPSEGSPEAIINSWLNIDVHRANILSPHHRQLGISVMDMGGKRIVTIIFTN